MGTRSPTFGYVRRNPADHVAGLEYYYVRQVGRAILLRWSYLCDRTSDANGSVRCVPLDGCPQDSR
jgi:hypothetical protein